MVLKSSMKVSLYIDDLKNMSDIELQLQVYLDKIENRLLGMKTLALPILIQWFTVLPDSCPDILKKIQAKL